MKQRVTITIPENVVRAIDNIPGFTRSGFISHILQMYLESLIQHYKANPISTGARNASL